MKDFFRGGLDVGSTTAKMVVIDAQDNIVYSRYERHNAKVKELVSTYLDEIGQKLPNKSFIHIKKNKIKKQYTIN